MSEKITGEELGKILWDIAVTLRGTIDSAVYKDYALGLMFIKRISDQFDEQREQVIAHYLSKGKTQSQAEQFAKAPEEYADGFFVPENARWEHIKDLKRDIGAALNDAAVSIEEVNGPLEGVLTPTDFNAKNNITDKKLQELINKYSEYRFRNSDLISEDAFGDAYIYLLQEFASGAGKKGGEFYTPKEVVRTLVELLKPTAGMSIYDPTAGSGGMLVTARNYLVEHNEDPRDLSLSGQEMNVGTLALCKMNMFLHDVYNADIRSGDTLRDPQHTKDGVLSTFDMVLANPPFSLDKWGKEEAEADPHGRFGYGIPPKTKGDLAFVQHMISSLVPNGRMGVVVPHGVLFRGAAEKRIRQGIIEDDLLEAVVGLPAKLFYGTGIPAALLIINKNKPNDRKQQILFINGELEYEEGKNQNRLRAEDIGHIVSTFERYGEEKRYATVVPLDEIRENDYNLNIRRYADTSPPPEPFDVMAVLQGGVPVSEVEDEYVQETLQGMDVSCVFESDRICYEGHEDVEYYEFKSEIETKEQIRDHLGDADQAVIDRFEKWWDKYRVSLHELDEQVDAAEAVMWEYLDELGYE